MNKASALKLTIEKKYIPTKASEINIIELIARTMISLRLEDSFIPILRAIIKLMSTIIIVPIKFIPTINAFILIFYILLISNYNNVIVKLNNMRKKMAEQNYEELIGQWHKDRNLIDGSTDKDQYMKLVQEAGELSDSLCKNKDIRDDIGDMMVVLINIMVRNKLTMKDCLEVAYNDIKDRKGKMIDGIFVKEGDE